MRKIPVSKCKRCKVQNLCVLHVCCEQFASYCAMVAGKCTFSNLALNRNLTNTAVAALFILYLINNYWMRFL